MFKLPREIIQPAVLLLFAGSFTAQSSFACNSAASNPLDQYREHRNRGAKVLIFQGRVNTKIQSLDVDYSSGRRSYDIFSVQVEKNLLGASTEEVIVATGSFGAATARVRDGEYGIFFAAEPKNTAYNIFREAWKDAAPDDRVPAYWLLGGCGGEGLIGKELGKTISDPDSTEFVAVKDFFQKFQRADTVAQWQTLANANIHSRVDALSYIAGSLLSVVRNYELSVRDLSQTFDFNQAMVEKVGAKKIAAWKNILRAKDSMRHTRLILQIASEKTVSDNQAKLIVKIASFSPQGRELIEELTKSGRLNIKKSAEDYIKTRGINPAYN